METRHCRIVFFFASFLFLSVVSVQAKPVLIRFSHVVSENTPKGIGAKLFKKKVDARLAGKVEVQIYPHSEKYTDEQAILGLLFGDVEMVAPSFSKFYKFSKTLAIFDQPFFFNSIEEVHNFEDSTVGRQLLSSMEDRGIKGLCYWDNGMRVISMNRQIRVPADMKGLSIRIEPSNIIYSQYTLLGALPIPMPFKQLRDALRINLVDGHENAWSNISSMNLQQYRHHFLELNHSYLGYMVATSVHFWKGLPADIRIELEKILAEVRIEVAQIAAEKAKADRQKVLSADGVELITPTKSEKQHWQTALLPVWKEYASAMGDEMISKIEKAKEDK